MSIHHSCQKIMFGQPVLGQKIPVHASLSILWLLPLPSGRLSSHRMSQSKIRKKMIEIQWRVTLVWPLKLLFPFLVWRAPLKSNRGNFAPSFFVLIQTSSFISQNESMCFLVLDFTLWLWSYILHAINWCCVSNVTKINQSINSVRWATGNFSVIL